MSNKLEVNLTPQNQEWIKLIPNANVNQDIVFNKLIETAISEGLLLEVISNSLTVGDLSKFKTTYSKMQSKRAGFLEDLDVTPPHIDRKKVTQTFVEEIEEEEIEPTPTRKVIKKTPKKEVKSHGFTEDSF
jgi:hypothetical protein